LTLNNSFRAIVPVLMFVLVACGSSEPVEPTAAPPAPATIAPTTAPTPVPPAPEPPTPETASEPDSTPVVGTQQLSFSPATYEDESAGFALEYPADWTLDPSSQVGVRGGQAVLLSPGTTLETLADGGTRVAITTYIWDPKNDLDAYVATRKTAWDASGFTITREEQWTLPDGRPAYVFIVEMPEQPTFNLLTTVGEDYLQISGDGDQTLIGEIAHTLRPLN
jgi:hypothetical protein